MWWLAMTCGGRRHTWSWGSPLRGQGARQLYQDHSEEGGRGRDVGMETSPGHTPTAAGSWVSLDN